MNDRPFGRSSAGLLQRRSSHPVEVSDLREVAEQVLPELVGPGLRLGLDTRPGAGSMLVMHEGERMVRTPLDGLADAMTRAGVLATPEGIAAALGSWVEGRPVSDAAAVDTGVAVLDWVDTGRRAVAWRVVVCRGARALPWHPSPAARSSVRCTRAAAAARAREVALELRVEGPVLLWSHAAVPVLSTAVLSAPSRMMAAIAERGPVMTDVHVVITPYRPVACAAAGIAARLAGEATEASVTLPLARLTELPWG